MTTREYYVTSRRRGSAVLNRIDCDERGDYLVLDSTLFHPQGGGQPADMGTVEGVAVTHVAAAGDEIRHYVAATDSFAIERTVALEVDDASRSLHERLHTAGHLIGSLVELLVPQAEAIAGHHWPGQSRVDFALAADTLDADVIRLLLEAELRRAIARGPAVYSVQNAPGQRAVVIEGYRPMGCGGTHVASVSDIGDIQVCSAKVKKGVLRIGYDVPQVPG